MEKRKTNILLDLIDDIIIKYQKNINTKKYFQQKLHEKCNREGIYFFSKF